MKVDIYSTDKKYNVIYADPAWQFNNKHTGGSMKSSAQDQYTVTSITDMCRMPVWNLAADNCLLVMWYVGSMPKEAIQLCEAWGFRILNMNGFVWEKLTKTGKPFFGMGFSTRAGSESAIIAVKGKITELIKDKSVRAFIKDSGAVIPAKVGRHSEKPQVFRDAIETLCGDVPRIELFAREHRDGWDCWGNEV
ncbi:MAG: MT-A70 family methyltransferase [Aeromonadaceae bacterium]